MALEKALGTASGMAAEAARKGTMAPGLWCLMVLRRAGAGVALGSGLEGARAPPLGQYRMSITRRGV